MKLEANVILGKCYNKELYGMRVQKIDGDWMRTWAFPIKAGAAQDEGFDNVKISGSFFSTKEYPGCPYCEQDDFIVCGACKKISCYHGEEISVCQWCGNSSAVSSSDSLDVSGGGY